MEAQVEYGEVVSGAIGAPPVYASEFPLYWDMVFDRVTSPGMGWNVAYQSTFPEELIRRVTASWISIKLGISVNSAEKYIPPDTKYHEDVKTDQKIRCACLDHISHEMGLLIDINKSQEHQPSIGWVVSDNALLSAKGAIKVCFDLADVGYLYETSAVARSCLEQLAWSQRVAPLDDPRKIQLVSAQSEIGSLVGLNPSAGRLYGWLSKHSHWAYDAHWKSFDEASGYVTAVQRSVRYKVQAYAALIVISKIFSDVLRSRLMERGHGWEASASPFDDLMETLLSFVKPAPDSRRTVDEVSTLAEILSMRITV